MLFDYIGHYYTWANDKFRKELGELEEEQFTEKDEDMARSMKDLVIHQIITNEYLMVSPAEVSKLIKNLEFQNKMDIINFWKDSDERFAIKVNGEFKGIVDMPVSEDKTINIGKDEMLFAYTDHSTFHRGQMLSLLKKYTHKGISTDFYSYLMVKYA